MGRTECIQLAQDKIETWAFVNKVMDHIMVSSIMTPCSMADCVPTFKRNIRLPSSDTEKLEAVYTSETSVLFFKTTWCLAGSTVI